MKVPQTRERTHAWVEKGSERGLTDREVAEVAACVCV